MQLMMQLLLPLLQQLLPLLQQLLPLLRLLLQRRTGSAQSLRRAQRLARACCPPPGEL